MEERGREPYKDSAVTNAEIRHNPFSNVSVFYDKNVFSFGFWEVETFRISLSDCYS